MTLAPTELIPIRRAMNLCNPFALNSAGGQPAVSLISRSTGIVARGEPPNDGDQTQVGAMSAEAVYS
jgi:hypothetical protein